MPPDKEIWRVSRNYNAWSDQDLGENSALQRIMGVHILPIAALGMIIHLLGFTGGLVLLMVSMILLCLVIFLLIHKRYRSKLGEQSSKQEHPHG